MSNGLRYVLKPDEIHFYYDDMELIKNSRSNPFIYAVSQNDESEKNIALYDYKIMKYAKDLCEIKFFCENLSVYCIMTGGEKRLNISFTKSEEIKSFNITLLKEPYEQVFGLCAARIENNKKQVLYNRERKIEKKKATYETNRYYTEYVGKLTRKFKRFLKKTSPDLKLAFYLDKKYFFENKNIIEYELEINDNICVKTPQKYAEFELIFNNNIHIASNGENKNSESVKKYYNNEVFLKMRVFDEERIAKFERKTNMKVSGIVFVGHKFDRAKTNVLITTLHKKGYDAIFAFDAEVKDKKGNGGRKMYEIKKNAEGDKKINFGSERACRKYLNIIRQYLDVSADGVYLENGFDKEDMFIIHKEMNEIIREYPFFTIFHDRISELNDDLGYYIIKNKNLIRNFDRFSADYIYSGENRIGKEYNRYRKRRVRKDTFPFNIAIFSAIRSWRR